MNYERIQATRSTTFAPIGALVLVYLLATAATLGLLAWKHRDPAFATQEAWIHASIVFVFALVMALTSRRAAKGDARAVRRLQIVATVLTVATLVEAVIPGLFPVWMRLEQIMYGAVLLVLAVLLARARRLYT